MTLRKDLLKEHLRLFESLLSTPLPWKEPHHMKWEGDAQIFVFSVISKGGIKSFVLFGLVEPENQLWTLRFHFLALLKLFFQSWSWFFHIDNHEALKRILIRQKINFWICICFCSCFFRRSFAIVSRNSILTIVFHFCKNFFIFCPSWHKNFLEFTNLISFVKPFLNESAKYEPELSNFTKRENN